MKKYDVLGIGNALLDYQIEVPFEFLEQKGFTRGSMTLVDASTQHTLIEELQNLYGKSSLRASSGGCSANTLAGLANYGGDGFFVGKIGNDEQGRLYETDMKNARVDSLLTKHSDTEAQHKTGTCLALITPDAERTMLTHLGVATEISDRDIPEDKIEASEIVYIEGYLWDPPAGRKASLYCIERAREKKKKVAFTFSDSFCVDRYFSDFVSLAKSKIDILFCNDSEALRATETKSVDQAFRILKEWAPIVCITTGPRGALLSNSLTKEVEDIPTWDVKLIDKIGAGDLFAAGVLFGLTQKKSLRESGFLGCYSATKIIQQMSARLNEDLSKQIATAITGPGQRAVEKAS